MISANLEVIWEMSVEIGCTRSEMRACHRIGELTVNTQRMFQRAASILMLLVLSSCAQQSFNTTARTDAFTDEAVCRVQQGTEFTRAFTRGVLKLGITYNFFAENRAGEPRVGIISEPLVPIAGDVQIRVDSNPARIITVADTPLDTSTAIPAPEPQNPYFDKSYKELIENIQKFSSPYRAYTGDKARELLLEIANGNEVIFRILGVNSATSSTARFSVTDDLRNALRNCGLI